MRLATKRASLFFGLVAVGGIFVPTSGCSLWGCTEFVKSKDEAHKALQSFFTSQTSSAKSLIRELRRDGMTDENLARLQQGCPSCWVHLGDPNGHLDEEADRWYVSTPIAPPEAEKSVVLMIECERSVELHLKLYGG